ncbi:MAG: hypothetical protein GIKADHBN_01406 [Phycisphaerales bacterium]|nr:hypothetical protein [Phycisphaerales bacterium]
MSVPRRPLTAQRLAEVSDALLLASQQHPGPPGQPRKQPPGAPSTRHPLEHERGLRRTGPLQGCADHEIEQALAFLRRLGFIGPAQRFVT